MPESHAARSIEIRPDQRVVLVDGRVAPLRARAFDLLMALLERRDRVVTKNELLDLVWPGLVVEENNLQVQVSSLRKALGPGAIATVPGRGYRCTLSDAAVVRRTEGPRLVESSPAAGAAVAGNLPPPRPLYGRDAELAEIGELVAACPLVTLAGAGGIGKSHLALAAAAHAPLDAADGRWWIELGAVNRPDHVVSAIASALAVPLAGGRSAEDALGLAVASRRMLLVLDNAEHLADALAAVVTQLRAHAPGVRVLVTSQEPLKCAEEHVFRLGPLPVAQTADPEAALECGAVALFVARAREGDARFRLSKDNVAAVIEICRRLDGIPLAIELAAARLPLLGVDGVRARLDRMFNVLTGATRMTLRRHQTMRAALDWSCSLLAPDEAAVFRRLGVFAGGFTLDLAQRVASDDAIDEWQVVDCMAQLVDRSLLVVEGEGEPRYRLLEPTRAFALEQLAAADESDRLLQRHAEALLAFVTAMEAARYAEPMARRLARLAELANFRAAVDWAMTQGADGHVLACRLLANGWFMWVGNNVSREGLERMLACLPLPGRLPPEDEARFCLAIASLRNASSRDEVLRATARAIELYRALGDRARLGDALCRLACMTAGQRNDTEHVLAEAAACIDERAPARQHANLASVRGAYALARRDFAAAAQAFRDQAEWSRRDGAEVGEYMALINLAEVSLDVGDIETAIDGATRAIDGLQRNGVRHYVGMARAIRTVALAVRGDDVDVPALARESFEQSRQAGATFRPLMAAALYHARRGELRRAALIAQFARSTLRAEAEVPFPFDSRLIDELQRLVAGAPVDEARLVTEDEAVRLAFGHAQADDAPPRAAAAA